MRKPTYEEIRTKVERDLDLQEEDFITPEELLGYYNEAVDDCEAEIHKLSIEDEYFLTSAQISVESGTAEYDLPTDIYGNKIRSFMYSDGNRIYPIRRLKGSKKFEEIAVIGASSNSLDAYAYLIRNASADDGPQLVLYPTPAETSDTRFTLWYVRNANRAVDDDSICDIPEGANFIMQHMKMRCYEKEGHPNLGFAVQALQAQRALMIDTLSEMIPDQDDEVEKDLSIYQEMS